MTKAQTSDPRRIRAPWTPLVDIFALLVFALSARMAHGGVTVTAVLNTFWPWALAALIGWAIVLGLRIRNLWKEACTVWLTTVIAGMLIWAVVNAKFPHWSFLLVATLTSALFLFGWRAIAAATARKSRSH